MRAPPPSRSPGPPARSRPGRRRPRPRPGSRPAGPPPRRSRPPSRAPSRSSSGSSSRNVAPVSGSWPRSPGVQPPHPGRRRLHLGRRRERPGPDELDGPLEPAPRLGRIEQRRVLVGPAHHPRVQRLQQQRPEPAHPQHRLQMHPPGHRRRPEQPVIHRRHPSITSTPSGGPSPRPLRGQRDQPDDPWAVRLHDRLDGGERGRPQRARSSALSPEIHSRQCAWWKR